MPVPKRHSRMAIGVVIACAATIVAIITVSMASGGHGEGPSASTASAESSVASATQESDANTTSNSESAQTDPVVQTSNPLYTYEEMREDLDQLAKRYPDLVSVESIGTSVLGSDIPAIRLGNPSASHNVMIQSTLHGREYLATQATMKIVEYYCTGYEADGGNSQVAATGTNFRDLLDGTCFYVVPMANPDGVRIAQTGTDSITRQQTVTLVDATSDARTWKSNANGVDLNRNFAQGWEELSDPALKQATEPGNDTYRGTSPASEPETQALVTLASARDYDCFFSYHMAGNYIYYDQPDNTPATSAASTQLAQAVNNVIACQHAGGYHLSNTREAYETQVENVNVSPVEGGFNDWAQVALGRPGITVEMGDFPKESDSDFSAMQYLPQVYNADNVERIYEENRDTWAAAAMLYR